MLYATARSTRDGTTSDRTDVMAWNETPRFSGGHAFAIVAYDERAFWIQNSWGADWGYDGFWQISYDDWLANGSDVWVARLGAPIELRARESVSRSVGVAAQGTRSYVFCDLRPHIISLGNNGALRTDGTYGTSERRRRGDFQSHRDNSRPAINRLLIYAHGGLTTEDSAIQKVADLRSTLLDAGIYPVSLIWRTDFWTTLRNLLEDAVSRRRPEGMLDATKDFMLDRLDDALEPIARVAGGQQPVERDEGERDHGPPEERAKPVRRREIAALKQQFPALEVHLVGHSAGAILLGGLMQRSPRATAVARCAWHPARSGRRPARSILPAALPAGAFDGVSARAARAVHAHRRPSRTTLREHLPQVAAVPRVERIRSASCANRGSARPTASRCSAWRSSWRSCRPRTTVRVGVVAEREPRGDLGASKATAHGAFDDDAATLKATMARILGESTGKVEFAHHRSESAQRRRREAIMQQTPIDLTRQAR